MKVLLFGANGQLGSDIVRLWNDPDLLLAGVTRSDADVTDAEAVTALVQIHGPDVVINTTAFHNLPVCEQDPDACFHVNVTGGRNIAAAAAAAGSAIVQISTDYVFDGTKRSPYLEDDARRAVNVYGAAKIATEDVVRIANPDAPHRASLGPLWARRLGGQRRKLRRDDAAAGARRQPDPCRR